MSDSFGWRRRSMFRWLTAVGAAAVLSLAVMPVAAAEPSPDAEDGGQRLSPAEVEALLDQTVNGPLVDATAAIEKQGIGGVGDNFPSIFAGFEVVNDGKQLNVLYNANGDNQVLADFLARVEAVGSTADLKVSAVPVDFDPQQRAELARKISADSEGWAEQLGVSSVSSVRFDTVSGEVSIVTTDESIARRVEVLEVEGVPVSVVVDTTAEAAPQNRAVDSAPWTGGTRIRYSGSPNPTDCTLGFNWRKWGTTEAMGSTANHCYSATGASHWYNGVTSPSFIGQRYYYNVAKDTMLLRSSPQGQFQARVWVGDAVTNDSRAVHTGQATEPVGTAIALSAAVSGLHVGTILSTTDYYQGWGPFRHTTVSACRGGDSGGPWLTTRTDGKAIGHGQHFGYFTVNGLKRCSYMPVTPISAALSATLMTQ